MLFHRLVMLKACSPFTTETDLLRSSANQSPRQQSSHHHHNLMDALVYCCLLVSTQQIL